MILDPTGLLLINTMDPEASSSSSSRHALPAVSSADGSSDLNAKSRKRASKPKVRTGCITCKQRRVKCDETRPRCLRCSKAALVCQGYAVKKPQTERTARPLAPRPEDGASEGVAIAPRPQTAMSEMSAGGLNDEQARSFNYFRSRTAREMSDLFVANNFWEGQVFRMCESEPSIRDAAVALGMLHEMHSANPRLRARSDPADPTSAMVLNQYNRAIEGVNNRLSSSPFHATEVALVSCLLFLGIDILLARFDAATKHVQNGLRILQEWKPPFIVSSTPNETPLTHVRDLGKRFDTDEEQLAAQFARLNFNVSFVSVTTRKRAVEEPIPAFFTNLLQARIQLSMSGEIVVGFSRALSGTDEALNPSPNTVRRQRDLASRLRQWKTSFDASLDTTLADVKESQKNAIMIMRMHYLGMTVMIDSALSGACEMTFDEHEGRFREMVSIGQEIIESGVPLPTLCYDVGIIYPLFSTAIKCRNPFVRRQAIKLMESFPHREGTMDSLSAAQFATKIMNMEEAGFEGLEESRELPEYARFHQALMVPPSDGSVTGMMICKRRRHDMGDWITVRHPYSLLG